MKFLSIYKANPRSAPPSPEEMQRMGKLIEEDMKRGILLAVEGCLPEALGARVRIDNGKHTVTDGPYSESKEVVGGLAIIRANSKAEAVEYAKQFLSFMGEGECDLRQLYEEGAGQPNPCAETPGQSASAASAKS